MNKTFCNGIRFKSLSIALAVLGSNIISLGQDQYVSSQKSKNSFGLTASGKSAALFTSPEDYPGVIRALGDLQSDIEKVTNVRPSLFTDKLPDQNEVVVAGTIGKNKLIDDLIKNKKLDVSGVTGKWETFTIQAIENPFPKVSRALVIAGSDKRGTIFGIYDLSKQIGVSPWYWWADVPPKKSKELFVLQGNHTQGEPKVKYRGIFINDEAPAFSGWIKEKFPNGDSHPEGVNHVVYEKIFELILRLKGNYLWPAMWGRSIYDDDPASPKLADEYGIVIGMSHHEPMMRAHVEWQRYGGGTPWNYETNEVKLREFWTEGIRRMGENESIISLAMRGDGDMAMSQGTNIALLEKIVHDQREIIANVTRKDVTKIPQLWALYKEVQDYYDKGMRAPDDVTLLLCDDNWGNIRKLPRTGDPKRSGGYGIYYHFDYVGGPRNYKWINTNPIARVWEQMNMAYSYGADRIWIVNVGDIKPMEFPTEFFLDMAWNPNRFGPENIDQYTMNWARRQFGEAYAKEISTLISSYSKFNGRRKPELLAPETYSLNNYNEAEKVVTDYNKLVTEAERINGLLPAEYKDAFFQLVLHPVKASANINELYVTVAKNKLYESQGRSSTNDLAAKAKSLFEKDAEISKYYNVTLAGGKWSHMMDQTHIGYTYWQQPPKDKMPEVKEINIPSGSELAISIEGSDKWWPNEKTEAVLPRFDNPASNSYFEIFNRGSSPFDFKIQTTKSWIQITPSKGNVIKEQRVVVNVDWSAIPNGKQYIPITVSGPSGDVVVFMDIMKNPNDGLAGFVESRGAISIEANHFTKANSTEDIQWRIIPDLGRTGSAITTFPVTAPSQTLNEKTPHLEYNVILSDSGTVKLLAYFSPSLNFNNTKGLRYAISFDNEQPVVGNLHEDTTNKAWENWVANNIIIKSTTHKITQGGQHVIKFWMVDSGVVLQKLVVDTGGLKPSYLGPQESYFKKPTSLK